MAPRGYKQKRRAEAANATRRRIVDAAVAIYRDRGVSGASIQAVAERADVARGTVVNHFGGLDGLLEAVLDRAVEDIEYPDERDFAEATTADARIRRFVDVMYRFFERGTDWWQIFYADLQLPALQERERQYYEIAARVQAAAFGDIADDRIVAAAVRTFVDYGPWHALKSAGLTLDESIEVIGDALVDIARRRRDARSEERS
jgi:AcrR family transcriptional regulator